MNAGQLKKDERFAKMARLASFAALLCIFLNFYLYVIVANKMTQSALSVITVFIPFNTLGILTGAALCPLFLPLVIVQRRRGASPDTGTIPEIVFILLAVLPNILLRSLGMNLYMNSTAVSSAVHFFTGIITSICYGLFFRARLCRPRPENSSRIGRFSVFLFALGISCGHLARESYTPLLGILGLEHLKAVTLIYNILIWVITGAGVFSIVCVVLQRRCFAAEAPPQEAAHQEAPPLATDWSFIFTLIGIAAVSGTLNALTNMRYTPSMNLNSWLRFPYIVIASLPFLGFLAGKSIQVFLRRFLPPAVIFFILLPTLVVLESQPFFIQCMNTLVTIFNNLLWVVFTAAAVEAYHPARKGAYAGFWFYFVVIAIHFTLNVFPFLITPITRLIPSGTEYSIVIICVAAVLFMLLSFRILAQNPGPHKAPAPSPVSFEAIYRKYGLTKQEIVVADMIVKEGLNNEKIAGKIYRSVDTVKKHVSGIFTKFAVKTRAELMSAVMREREKQITT